MSRRANGEGSIYFEASSGRWVGAISVDGKRRKVKGRTQQDVRQRLEALKRTVADGLPTADGNMTVGHLIPLTRSGPSAVESDVPRRLRRTGGLWASIGEELGTKRLRALTVEDVEHALDACAAEGLSRASLIKVRSVLGQALDFAERRQLVGRNVARLAELFSRAPRQLEGRALTIEQARHFIVVAKGDRLEALWLVMLGCGLRPGEALGLEWGDVDVGHGRLHIRRSLKFEHGTFVVDERLEASRVAAHPRCAGVRRRRPAGSQAAADG